MDYQGIIFPDRAEALKEDQFRHYKVFLGHWAPLANTLRQRFEDLSVRAAAHCVLIYGPQGSGKTLFAQKLVGDHKVCVNAIERGEAGALRDDNNLWSLMTGTSRLDARLIEKATVSAEILHIENDDNWVENAIKWRSAHPHRPSIIVADNAERSYFRQALSGLDTANYLKSADLPELTKRIAERFVSLCRAELRKTVFVCLTNDAVFADAFSQSVQRQHQGLVVRENLGLPDSDSKETVVRVNTNRLNAVSYWYCLDRAGPSEKKNVFETLKSADTFPAAFKAVDAALKGVESSRGGRPARKNQLTFAVLTDAADTTVFQSAGLGVAPQDLPTDRKWCKMLRFNEWAKLNVSGLDGREMSLLSSEWDLRIFMFGEPFASALLCDRDNTKVKNFLDLTFVYHGPGTQAATRTNHKADLDVSIDALDHHLTLKVPDFWAKGASRNADYEKALTRLYPGRYNRGSAYLMGYRPDLAISAYIPCGILKSADNDVENLNYAIRRDANLVEFTAIKDYNHEKLLQYMAQKLPNYLKITQEQ